MDGIGWKKFLRQPLGLGHRASLFIIAEPELKLAAVDVNLPIFAVKGDAIPS